MENLLKDIDLVIALCRYTKKCNRFSALFIPRALKSALIDFESPSKSTKIKREEIKTRTIAVYNVFLKPQNRFYRFWNWVAAFFFKGIYEFINASPALSERLKSMENFNPEPAQKAPPPPVNAKKSLPPVIKKEVIQEDTKEQKIAVIKQKASAKNNEVDIDSGTVQAAADEGLGETQLVRDETVSRDKILETEEKKHATLNKLHNMINRKLFFFEESTERSVVEVTETDAFHPISLLHEEMNARRQLLALEQESLKAFEEQLDSDLETLRLKKQILLYIREFGIITGLCYAIHVFGEDYEKIMDKSLTEEMRPWMLFCNTLVGVDKSEREYFLKSAVTFHFIKPKSEKLATIERKIQTKSSDVLVLAKNYIAERYDALEYLSHLDKPGLEKVYAGKDVQYIKHYHASCPLGKHEKRETALQYAEYEATKAQTNSQLFEPLAAVF